MFQVYFCIGIVVFAVALTIGLISEFASMSEKITEISDFQFFWQVGKTTALNVPLITLLIILVIIFLKKRGYKIKITKELIENK